MAYTQAQIDDIVNRSGGWDTNCSATSLIFRHLAIDPQYSEWMSRAGKAPDPGDANYLCNQGITTVAAFDKWFWGGIPPAPAQAADPNVGKCVATSGQNKITISSETTGVKFVSCADSCGAYMYVLTPSGKTLGKVDVPKGGCRTDTIAWSYFKESGQHTAILASYDLGNVHLYEAGFNVILPSPPPTTKPPAEGTPETFYETYRGYTINTQGSYLHVLRPDGTGIGLFNSVIAARQGVDADIDSLTPKTCPSGQYLDISSKIPQCLPYPSSPEEAGTSAYAPPVVPGTSPSQCGTGTYYDYGTGKCLPYTPPASPVIPSHGQRYCVDESTIAVWNNEKQDYDVAKCQNPPCKDGYCAQPQPEKPQDLTILYLLGAVAIGAIALFGGKKR